MDQIEKLRYLIKAAEKEGEDTYRKMLSPLGITPSQNEVLKILSIQDGLSINQIGELLICGSDSPSRIIQRLLLKGWIEKKINPKDVRRTDIYITNEGLNLLKESTAIENQFNQGIKDSLNGLIDINDFISLLEKQVDGSKTLMKINNRDEMDH